jgi:excinuclease UvrABC ATPase subunit
VLACRIDGRSIADWCAPEVDELLTIVGQVDSPLAATIVPALADRLQHLIDIGLGYLALCRGTTSLSGGESQRVKMVRHLGSSLSNMSYIFDEPSVGLHPRDVARLNELLRQLCVKGNTVPVVEHDPDIIVAADHVIDMGPGAGDAGGSVVFEGGVDALRLADTATGRCLSRPVHINTTPRTPSGWLPIVHANLHNLKDVNVSIPKGVMTVVTGVAGCRTGAGPRWARRARRSGPTGPAPWRASGVVVPHRTGWTTVARGTGRRARLHRAAPGRARIDRLLRLLDRLIERGATGRRHRTPA